LEITGEISEVFPMKEEIKLINKVKCSLKRLGCPRYFHHFGPKTYEFYQHVVALLLKEVFKLSFRRVSNLLNMLGIEVPTYSSLCITRKKIPLYLWKKFLQITVEFESYLVAVDSTGFSRTNPSWHYVKRIDKKNPVKRFIKLSALFDTRRKKFLAIRIRSKPRHDIKDVNYLLRHKRSFKKLLGDSAYDAESLHKLAYEKGIVTVIKPRKNVKKGFYRKKQMKEYRKRTYHRRSMIESGFGSLKRRYGSCLLAKAISTQRAEIYCRVIAHNLNLLF